MSYPSFDIRDYADYHYTDLCTRWLRQDVYFEVLDAFIASSPELTSREIGRSVEGRELRALSWGQGSTKLMLWTQMHGNEPTASLALIDLLQFLLEGEKYRSLREFLRENLRLLIIPMLNPDGAERFTRENALGVDLNRDNLRRSMPETQAFHRELKDFAPDWTFNLHDQRNIFSAGEQPSPATLSFLSASADSRRTLNPARESSMKLIAKLQPLLQRLKPGQIGRYSDEFYPRALGDYCHQRGIPCVLIESGADFGDPLRLEARKLNFVSLLEAFALIAADEIQTGELSDYEAIPENQTRYYDWILRNTRVHLAGKEYEVDLALLLEEQADSVKMKIHKVHKIKEIGDLSYHYALNELSGGEIRAKKPCKLNEPAEFEYQQKGRVMLRFKRGLLIQ